jgi:hypothetical protein
MQTDKTEAQSRRDIVDEFDRWNREKRGTIGAYDFPAPEQIGGKEATVRLVLRGDPKVLKCDSQPSYRLNLRCLFYAIEALRMNEKRGIGDLMRSVYLALDGPADHWRLLGIEPGATREEIERAYKAKAQDAHPDTGGSNEAMASLNAARETALAEVSR